LGLVGIVVSLKVDDNAVLFFVPKRDVEVGAKHPFCDMLLPAGICFFGRWDVK
jgi:hypothetical protein